MIQELDEPLMRARKLKETWERVGDAMNLSVLEKRQAELTAEQHKDNFWDDLSAAQKVNQELKGVENKLNRYKKAGGKVEDILLLIELSDEAKDLSSLDEIKSELAEAEKEVEDLRLETLLKGKYDQKNAIMTLHSGAGGTEAQDWTSMLYRIYKMYAERKGFSVKELDYLEGDEAGIKSVTFLVSGENAYGYLKAEKGVHRLVRISPFDSNSRRHTSFASLEVMPEIDTDIDIKINPEDLKVDTYRSGGAGGQHVNKTESAIRITHLPTGIIVQCQNERSQIQNREVAMKMLRSKLVEKAEREQMEEAQELKGELKKIEWGSQIRSYVFQPYTMVKDHRTGCETGNIGAVMDGEIDEFITDYLSKA